MLIFRITTIFLRFAATFMSPTAICINVQRKFCSRVQRTYWFSIESTKLISFWRIKAWPLKRSPVCFITKMRFIFQSNLRRRPAVRRRNSARPIIIISSDQESKALIYRKTNPDAGSGIIRNPASRVRLCFRTVYSNSTLATRTIQWLPYGKPTAR